MNRRKKTALTIRYVMFIAWIAAVVNCYTASVAWAAPAAGQFQLASAGSSDSEVEAKNNFGLAALTDQYGLDTSKTLSGVNAYVQSDGDSGSWRAGYSLDLSALQQIIDKGDLQVKVKFDALSYDGSLDDDWLYFKLEQKAANGSATTLKYIGDGENGTEKYFDDLQDWQNNLDLGWFSLTSGTRTLQLTFSSDDDDQEAGARNIRVYFKDKNRPLLSKISSDAVPGTFTAGQSIALKFEFDEPVTVDTTQTIAMNTGGSAVYVSGNQSNVLTYSYTVRSGDQQSALGFTNNPVTIVDQTLNAVDLSGNESIDTAAGFQNVLASSHFAVDGVPPAVNGPLTTSSVRDTVLKAGEAADISIYFTEPVSVTGSPQLHFNNGGTAVSTGIGNGVDHLTFRYTVDTADQDTAALDFALSGAFTGGTIVDAAGNAIQDRAVSGLLAQNIRIDRTPPAVAFSASNASVYKQSHKVRVDVSDTNGSGPDDLFSYYWSADSAPVSNWSGVTALTAAPGTEISTPADATGDYYLHVKAHDKAGNETVATQAVKLDNTKPTVAVDADGSTAPAQKYAVRIVASDSEAGINGNQIKYQWLKDNAAVDESKWTAGNLTDAIESDLTGASQSGQWKLAVRVEDQAGNRTDFISLSYSIDRDAPVVTVTPAGDVQYERSYQVTVNVQDAGGVQSVSYISDRQHGYAGSRSGLEIRKQRDRFYFRSGFGRKLLSSFGCSRCGRQSYCAL
ncbi:Ig-like domain repeat protein [Paenibacillus sp. TAB 01]|uniref:Ig-like domain repeat protein n=1 Tax=Paenibacillus sp. TAB 01 TaxID=3368988 RepID=UPI003750E0C2